MSMTEAVNVQWRGGGADHRGPDTGMEHRNNVLPREKLGKLRVRHQHKTDPNHWCIPPVLHLGALTKLVEVPDKLLAPRPYSGRGHQLQHHKIPEPAQPAGS